MTFTALAKGDKALRLDYLHIKNFRCFAEIRIEFHKSLTVLIANNGQGKTATLDAIATALGPFVGGFDDGKDHNFTHDDIRLVSVSGSNRMERADGGVVVNAHGLVNYYPVPWSRRLSGPKSRTTRKDAQFLVAFAKRLQSQVRREAEGMASGACLPIVAYYPTDRLWNIRRLPYKPLPQTSRMVGYTHCLESGSDFHLMAAWFRYWSINALNRRLRAQNEGKSWEPAEHEHAIEAVRNAVNLCLKPSGWRDLNFSIEREEIVVCHPEHGELPVAMLSDGIRSVLTLVADIAFRTVKLNPNLGPLAATHTQGIVLIDEVDMHLHPAWQQTILSSLREAFPCIQFIVTTHSPQVLTSVPVECIRLLHDDVDMDTGRPITVAQKFHTQTQGVASSTVLAELMGTDPVPDIQPKHWLSQYSALIQQGAHSSTEALALKDKLVAHYGAHHPLLQECERLIRLQGFRQILKHK